MSVEHVSRESAGSGGWLHLRRVVAWMVRSAPALLLAGVVLAATGCSHSSSSDTAPVITAQPTGGTVISGRQFTFTVTAKGSDSLTYQWSKDGKSILGAQSSTLILYNPGVQDSGQYTVAVTNALGTTTSGPTTLTVVAALSFTSPFGLAYDASGNLYVSDMDAHAIWKVDATDHKTLFAGSPGVPGTADGIGSAAQFRYPSGLAFDPSGNLLVADTGNQTLRRIAPDGTVTTVAGTAGVAGATNGQGTAALFNAPVGLAVDGTGVVYIADSQNHVIRKMATDGTVTTFAGSTGQPGFADGTTAALFNQPNGLALKADGTLLVADFGNSAIRAITSAGQVSTLTGRGTHGFADGTAANALLYWPVGLAVDATGTVWVADTTNHAIRKVQADGSVTTLTGSGGTSGNADGTGTAALFNNPCGIVLAPNGDLVVADTGNRYLRRATTAGLVTTFTAP